IRFYGNDSLVYEYADVSSTTPWLNLHARSFRPTLFRNASIRGDVRIPREVALTQGDRLDGWISSYYEEAQPPRLTVGMALNQPTQASTGPQTPRFPTVTREPVTENHPWNARDGVIIGRAPDEADPSRTTQSRLYYHRPLRDGESVRYEFLY